MFMKAVWLTGEVKRIIEEAIYQSLDFGSVQVGTEHLLFTLLQEESKLSQYLEKVENFGVDSLASMLNCYGIVEDERAMNTSFEFTAEQTKEEQNFKNEILKNIQLNEPYNKENVAFSSFAIQAIKEAIEIAKKAKAQFICIEHMEVALLNNTEYASYRLLEEAEIEMDELMKSFSMEAFFSKKSQVYGAIRNAIEDKKTTFSIPVRLDKMCTLLNEKYKKEEPNTILQREGEIEQVWNILLKQNKRNVILVGEAGVGKTAIAEGVAERIVKGKCPRQLKDAQVVLLDVNALIAGCMYVGMAEERFGWIISFLKENPNVILVIDEIHTILGAGSSSKSDLDFANALKPILARGETRVIGTTTQEEYKKYFKRDKALKRRFETIKVKEVESKKLYAMVEGKIKKLEQFHQVKVSKEMFAYVMQQAACYHYEKAEPDRSLDLLDNAMVVAKRSRKKELDLPSILKVHKENVKTFKKMDKKVKESTAYHEAGHYIIHKVYQKNLWGKVTAISIIPSEDDYIGVNVIEEDRKKFVETTYEQCLITIATNLAGRAAEKLTCGIKTTGAREDLKQANMFARRMVLEFGLCPSSDMIGPNSSFMNYNDDLDYEFLSNEEKIEVNRQVNQIIKEAMEKTEEILTKNRNALERIAQTLLVRGILTGQEADLLFHNKVKLEELPQPDYELIK